MANVTKVTIPYKPRPLQTILHNELKRFNVLVMHRRFGKTVFAINEIIRKAMQCPLKRPQYAYLAPEKDQARKISWAYVKEFVEPIPGTKINEAELKVTLPNGAIIYLLGADNPDRLRGMYFDGIVIDEVAQMPSVVWTEVIRPALSDRKGWAIFIGTPKGHNFFYDIYNMAAANDEWYTKVYKSSETGIIDPKELNSIKKESAPEAFEQEYECSFSAAIRGTYYGKHLDDAMEDNRITRVPWDSNFPVFTSWDLGISDKTCIWFAQLVGAEVRIIDYAEGDGESLNYYANVVKQKPYTYQEHILPHDAKQRSISTGLTRIQQLTNLGLKCKVARKLSIQEGISAVRSILPKCVFDAQKCAEGLKALKNYRAEYNDKMDVFKQQPIHDWASHAADAFRYLALGIGKAPTSFNQTMNDITSIDDFIRKNNPQKSSGYDPFLDFT